MVKKTLLMQKLFSASTKDEFKKRFSDVVEEAMEEGSKEFIDEDGNKISLTSDGSEVTIVDESNEEVTKLTVNPDDPDDYQLYAEVETPDQDIVDNLDGTNMEPEAEVEIVEGEDGKHFSISGKLIPRKLQRKVSKFFSDMEDEDIDPETEVELEETSEVEFSFSASKIPGKYLNSVSRFFSDLSEESDDIVDNLDGTNMEPEANVEIVEGQDGKHYSGVETPDQDIVDNLEGTNMEPEAVVEIVEGEDGKHFSIKGKFIPAKLQGKVTKFFSELSEVEDDIVDNLEGSKIAPESDVDASTGVVDKDKAGIVTFSKDEDIVDFILGTQGNLKLDKLAEKLDIPEDKVKSKCIDLIKNKSLKSDWGNFGSIKGANYQMYATEADKAAVIKMIEGVKNFSENHQDGRNVQYNGETWKCLREMADKCIIVKGGDPNSVKSVSKTEVKYFSDNESDLIKELDEKVAELQETKDKDLAAEVKSLAEALMESTESTEVKDMCGKYSAIYCDILDSDDNVAPIEEREEVVGYSVKPTPFNIMAFGLTGEPEVNERAKIDDAELAPKVELTEGTEKVFSDLGNKKGYINPSLTVEF